MSKAVLSFNTRKSLCNHLGEQAGNEVADLMQALMSRISQLERNKVDITPIVPMAARLDEVIAAREPR